jgi:hypothetical protein
MLSCAVATAQPAPAAAPATAPAAVPALAAPASAPAKKTFKVLQVDPKLKNNQSKINAMLSAGRFGNQAETDQFDEYYKKFFLARWTDPKSISSVPAWRKELRVSHLGKRTSTPNATAVHDHLNELLLEFMKDLVAGPYDPIVQINAMLMIGELNRVEQPPTPLPEALTYMLASAEDAKLSDALRVTALIGIQRHVSPPGIADEEVRKKVINALLQLAAVNPDASASRQWLLVQVVETLGLFGTVGENNAIYNAIAKIAANAKLSVRTRGAAAAALGRLAYGNAAGINPVETAAAMGQLAIDSCAEELAFAKSTELGVSRRRLKQALSAALTALAGMDDSAHKGIASLAREPAQKASIDDLQKLVKKMIDLIDDPKRKDEDIKEPVEELKKNLEAWQKKK